LTPAAVSRNVTLLERHSRVSFLNRSTRTLTLSEAGENGLLCVRAHLDGLQAAIALDALQRLTSGLG